MVSFSCVKIHSNIADAIDEIVKVEAAKPIPAWSSRADFVTASIMEKLEKLSNIEARKTNSKRIEKI